jgi:hypothetical protein
MLMTWKWINLQQFSHQWPPVASLQERQQPISSLKQQIKLLLAVRSSGSSSSSR